MSSANNQFIQSDENKFSRMCYDIVFIPESTTNHHQALEVKHFREGLGQWFYKGGSWATASALPGDLLDINS